MQSSSTKARPFDQGAASVKAQDGLPNPYPRDSVEFSNYELGRAHALRSRPHFAAAAPARAALARR